MCVVAHNIKLFFTVGHSKQTLLEEWEASVCGRSVESVD